MKKAFNFSSVCLFFVLFFGFTSCHCKKQTPTATATPVAAPVPAIATATAVPTPAPVTPVIEPSSQRDLENEGYTKATMVYFSVDGCNYLLQLEDNKKLEATNLPLEFKKEGLHVWIKYTAKKGAVSTCQAGQVVELADIQLRK